MLCHALLFWPLLIRCCSKFISAQWLSAADLVHGAVAWLSFSVPASAQLHGPLAELHLAYHLCASIAPLLLQRSLYKEASFALYVTGSVFSFAAHCMAQHVGDTNLLERSLLHADLLTAPVWWPCYSLSSSYVFVGLAAFKGVKFYMKAPWLLVQFCNELVNGVGPLSLLTACTGLIDVVVAVVFIWPRLQAFAKETAACLRQLWANDKRAS